MNSAGPLRILLVEDSPTDAELLQTQLRESLAADFTVTQAETVADALERLNHERFDVALRWLGTRLLEQHG